MKIGNDTQTMLRSSLATLYLPPTATPTDAKRAFRGLIRQFHPDLSGGTGSVEQLKTVLAAYRSLNRSGFLAESSAVGDIPHSGQLVDVFA